MRQELNKKASVFKINELDMLKNLDKDNAQYKTYYDLISVFLEENALTAAGMLDGMAKQIEDSLRKESVGRTLDTLKVEFY